MVDINSEQITRAYVSKKVSIENQAWPQLVLDSNIHLH